MIYYALTDKEKQKAQKALEVWAADEVLPPQPSVRRGFLRGYYAALRGKELPVEMFNEIIRKLEFAERQCELWEDCDADAQAAALEFRALAYKLQDWLNKQKENQ